MADYPGMILTETARNRFQIALRKLRFKVAKNVEEIVGSLEHLPSHARSQSVPRENFLMKRGFARKTQATA